MSCRWFLVRPRVILSVLSAMLVRALPNGQGLRPALGFSTWNWNQTCTTRAMLAPLAEAMVSRGLVQAGYTVFVADCAGPSRGADGGIVLPEAQWPGGVPAWNAYLHSLGMRAAFYTDYGEHGCCSCAWQTNGAGENRSFGDAGHIQADMAQLARWGTDYIKVDSCQPVAWRSGRPDDPAQYGRFRDAIASAAQVHPMVFSIIGFKGSPFMSSNGRGYGWLNRTGNSWRTSADIGYSWSSILANLDAQENVPGVEQLAGPGGFADLDMLMFGNPKAGLTPTQEASHLALWAILKSPLLLSTDVRSLTATQLEMLTNARMLAVSQDALGVQATRVLPRADFVAGGAVYGARVESGYSIGQHQQWELKVGGRLYNAASGLCLGRSAGSSQGAIILADCTSVRGVTWVVRAVGSGDGDSSGSCNVIASADNTSQCLGLKHVKGTSEYQRAAIVPCDSGTARHGWATTTQYLNITVGELTSCDTSLPQPLALDAAPRATTNVFAGPLVDGAWAVLLFNRADTPQVVGLDFMLLPGLLSGSAGTAAGKTLRFNVTEVWQGTALGTATGQLSSVLQPHAALFAVLSPVDDTSFLR